MNFRPPHRQRRTTEVNLTPLVDVVFILLIFFLITSTFVQNPGIEVDLPEATNAPGADTERSLVLGLTTEGRIIYQGQARSLTELEDILNTQFSEDSSQTIVLQADRDTAHGKVVEVMDVARQSGFERLAIATESAASN